VVPEHLPDAHEDDVLAVLGWDATASFADRQAAPGSRNNSQHDAMKERASAPMVKG
jgi:hypothetical protein